LWRSCVRWQRTRKTQFRSTTTTIKRFAYAIAAAATRACYQETVDADLSAAFQTFGAYLAQKFIVTQIGIIQNELEDAADMAALVLPEERVRRIAEEHLRSLGAEEAAHEVGLWSTAALRSCTSSGRCS
jgi:hypothetical protein